VNGYFQVLILDAPSTMDGRDLMDVEPLCDYKRAAVLRHGGTRKTAERSPEKQELALQSSIFDAMFSYGAVAVWGAHLEGFCSR
jgi:hypothetical protein